MGCILYELVIGHRKFRDDWEVLQYLHSPDGIEIPTGALTDEYWGETLHAIFSTMLVAEPAQRHSASQLYQRFAFHYQLNPVGHIGIIDDVEASNLKASDPICLRGGGVSRFASCSGCASFAFEHHGKFFICSAERGLHQILCEHPGPGLRVLAYAPHETGLLCSCTSGLLVFWNVETGQQMQKYLLNTILAAPARTLGHFGTWQFSIQAEWCLHRKLITVSKVQDSEPGHSDSSGIISMLFPFPEFQFFNLFTNGRIILCSNSGYAEVYDRTLKTLLAIIYLKERALRPKDTPFHPHRNLLLIPLDSGFEVYDGSSGILLYARVTNQKLQSLAFSPCGKYILVGLADRSIDVWECASAQRVHIIKVNTDIQHFWFCQAERHTCLVIGLEGITAVDFKREMKYFVKDSGDEERFNVRAALYRS